MNVTGMCLLERGRVDRIVFNSLSKGFTALRKVKNIQGGVYKVGISTWREPAVEKS